jgi:N-acetylglucosaminyldiphosphoundecaprenol N-acetyl-beta-D-mannosaminyltransferase
MIFNKLIADPKEVVHKVLDSIERQELLLLTYLNQHCFNIYYQNKVYSQLLDTKFEIYQADLGVFIAFKFLSSKKIRRIDATAMNRLILDELISKKIPLVIVGGEFDEKFVQEKCQKGNINLVCYQNGFFEEDQTENLIKELNGLNTQVFLIGMGVPRQEIFAEMLSRQSNSKVIICIGNFLEFYFGTKKRAPVFIQKIGFEWMFRLFTEPRRLWNRYLIGIPLFIHRILKVKFTTKNS